MTDRRRAKRFELYVPIQLSVGGIRQREYYTAHLRDISTHGIYFHSQGLITAGTNLELTFSLPLDQGQGLKVLVRASAKSLRVDAIKGDDGTFYGVAAALNRIDFVRPGQSVAA
jgi:hypothetical protein